MNFSKKPIMIALCAVLVLLMAVPLGACDDDTAGGTGRADSSSANGDVLAVSDGQDITQTQVDDLCAFIAMTYGMAIDEMSDSDKTVLTNQMIIFAADNVLIKNAVDASDKTASDNVKSSVDQQYEQIMTQAETAEQISAAGIAEKTVKEYLEASFYQEAFYEQIAAEQPVTQAEAQAYYDENKSQFVTPESISLSHILINDAELTDASRTSIEAIRQRAVDGEDFAELAETYSGDTGSAASGGDLGVVTKGMMVLPFEEAGFKLKNGEISDVVETEYGFHIIKANSDVTPEEQMSLEAAMPQIESALGQQKFNDALEKLKEANPVKYNVEVDPTTGEPPTTVPETSTDSEAIEGVTPEDTVPAEGDSAPADSSGTGDSGEATTGNGSAE
ncbi:MAG: peptidylprolyl isomerase [Clostridiales Family XIII bacterium]|jgi:parvulin-like peptidyl-prolyl isomerase|nr:peptidylprolyl isomerase [Clostridiales Family XIII bacterium]